ncbi:MAG: 50S ribosomal protein L29 [Candidatus Aenigmarchaeota archaeon]|nr:50S ribosomal protein L29 [Candidatus Aenigmarchaeota archaeon]
MAIIKKKELKNLSEEELDKRLADLRLELAKERAAAYVGAAKNPGKIREIKRTVARILTRKKERKIEKNLGHSRKSKSSKNSKISSNKLSKGR